MNEGKAQVLRPHKDTLFRMLFKDKSNFTKNRAEVVDVCIFEYNEELHLKTVKEEGVGEGIKIGKSKGIKKGIKIGKSQGIEAGENRFAELLRYLNASGRQEEDDDKGIVTVLCILQSHASSNCLQ